MRPFLIEHAVRFAGALAGTVLLLWLLLDVLAGAGAEGTSFLGGLFTGSFGRSVSQNAEIGRLIAERLTVTLPLALMAFLVAGVVGTGLAAATRMAPVAGVAALLSAVPAFWLGVLLILALAVGFKVLPGGGFVPWSSNPAGALASLVLPALALGLPHGGQLALMIGRSFAAIGDGDVMRLRTEGATLQEARWRLGIAAALPRLPGQQAQIFGSVLLGTVLVESMFYLPGLGRLALGAATEPDLPLLAASLFVLMALALSGMLVLNLGRLALDPGLKRGAA